MKVYQFGLLGCGMVSVLHVGALEQLPNARLHGVVGVSMQESEAYAQKYGIKAYESFDAMLADPQIDAVCICTPSMFHAEQAIKALRAGKHVVLEKPMALNTAEADTILQACEETGKLLTVIFQNRFSADVPKVRRLLEENAFGKITLVNLNMRYWRSDEYFASSNWRGRKACEGGGALMNQGIHGIDLLQYLMGMPTVHCSSVKTMVHNVEVEDSALALVTYDNGAMGTIQGSTCTWPGFPRYLEIHGEKGFVTLRENRIEQLETPEEKLDLREQLNDMGESFRKPEDHSSDLHAAQIANLLDAIEGKAELLVDAREGRKAIEIIETIYQRSV